MPSDAHEMWRFRGKCGTECCACCISLLCFFLRFYRWARDKAWGE